MTGSLASCDKHNNRPKIQDGTDDPGQRRENQKREAAITQREIPVTSGGSFAVWNQREPIAATSGLAGHVSRRTAMRLMTINRETSQTIPCFSVGHFVSFSSFVSPRVYTTSGHLNCGLCLRTASAAMSTTGSRSVCPVTSVAPFEMQTAAWPGLPYAASDRSC